MNQENKIVQAFGWQSLNAVSQSLIQLIFNSIMARLILKESFGIMAIVLIVMGFIEVFGQIGIGPAIIQRKEVTQNQLKSSFYLSILLSIFFFLLVYFLSPFIAESYQDSRLTVLLQVTALSFIISGAGIIPKSLLFKKLKYKELFISTMIGMFIGLILIGLPCAYFGLEVWAIVIYLLSQNLILTICYWYFNPVSLKGKPPIKHAYTFIRYGGGSTLFTLFNFLSSKADTFIVSKYFGGTSTEVQETDWDSTGIYDQSIKVMGYPITIIGKLSDSIMFSGLSLIQDQKAKLKYAFKTGFSLLSLISLPGSIFLSIYAREIVLIILGNKYLDAIPVVQILFLGLFFRTIVKLCDAVVRALDKVYLGAIIKFIYLLLITAFVFLMISDFAKENGIYYGLSGIAIALLVATLIQIIFMLNLCLKILELKTAEILKLLSGPLSIAALTGVISLVLKYGLSIEKLPALISLLIGLIGVAMAFVLVIWLWPFLFGKNEHNSLAPILKRLPQKGFIKTLTDRVVSRTKSS